MVLGSRSLTLLLLQCAHFAARVTEQLDDVLVLCREIDARSLAVFEPRVQRDVLGIELAEPLRQRIYILPQGDQFVGDASESRGDAGIGGWRGHGADYTFAERQCDGAT